MFQTPSRSSNFDSISARRSTAIGGQTPLLLECKRVDDAARFDDESAKENSVERAGAGDSKASNKFRVTFNNGQSVSSTGQQLGSGGFGSVYAVTDNHTGVRYALKVSNVAMKEADHKRLKEEVAIINMFKNHPHIVQYINAGIMRDNRAYVLLEKCSSQALQDVIAKRGGFNLEEVLWVSYQLCSAIRDLHAAGCIHRDLKPANLLFDFEGNLKVIDFGLSTRLRGQKSRKTIAGTAVFMAPEMVKLLKRAYAKKGVMPAQHEEDEADNVDEGDDTYSNEIDVWAIGIIMMSMVMGYSPYKEAMKGCDRNASPKERQQYLIDVVVANKLSWGDFEKKVDPGLKDFIAQVLTVNQRDRPTLDEMLEHPLWERRPRTAPTTLMRALGLVDRKSVSRALSARFSQAGGRLTVLDHLKSSMEKLEEIETAEREEIFASFWEQHKRWTQIITMLQLEAASRKIITKEEDKEFYRLMNQKRNSMNKVASGAGRSSSVALAQGGGNLMAPPSPNNSLFPQPLSGHPSPSYKLGVRRSVSVRSGSTARSTRGGGRDEEESTYYCMNKHAMTKITKIPKGYLGYDCNVCGAAFNTLSKSIYMYRCAKCDFDICRVCAEGHKELDKVFICDTCDKKFPTEQKMIKHSLTCRGPSIAGAPSPSTGSAGGSRTSGRGRATNQQDNDNRRAENDSSFELRSLSNKEGGPRDSNRSLGGASRVSTGTILLGADLDEVESFMGNRTSDDDPLRPLPASVSKPARGRKTANKEAGETAPRLTGRMSMQMPESVNVKRGRNSLQTLELEIEDDSEELRRQQEEAEAEEEPARKRQRNSKEDEPADGKKSTGGGRKSKTVAAKRLSDSQLPEGDDVPQKRNSGGGAPTPGASRNPSVTPSNASSAAASGRHHIEMNLLGAEKPGEPYKMATQAPRHVNPSKSRQRSVSHVRLPQHMVEGAQAPVAIPEQRFPGVYNGGVQQQQNNGLLNQSRATSVGTNQTNMMMLPGGMSANASPLQDPRGGGAGGMMIQQQGIQQRQPQQQRAESVPIQELPNGQKYVNIGGQMYLIADPAAMGAAAGSSMQPMMSAPVGGGGGFTYNSAPANGVNPSPRLPGQGPSPQMSMNRSAAMNLPNNSAAMQPQQQKMMMGGMMPSSSSTTAGGNMMNNNNSMMMMPPAPGLPRPQQHQQQQQQPAANSKPKRGFMALPEDKNNLQKYVSDFLSGAWVRQYYFCADGPVFLYYSLQPGRWGALFQSEGTSRFSTIVVDVNAKTAVISYDMDDNESYAHRTDGGQHGVQTTYHDRCEIVQQKTAQQIFPEVVQGILDFVERMVRMRSEGIPPATVTASYVHEPESASVPVTVPFAYVRKAFPDPNNTFCLFRLSNRRSQVIWNATEFDIRWQASRSSDVSLKYYVPRTGEITPFNNDEYDLMKKVNALLNEHPHENQ